VRFTDRPVDPRSRRVLKVRPIGKRDYLLDLECGHQARRRFLGPPASIVCVECPAAGGIGGGEFRANRP
jgi:hypothetical protein